MGLTPLEKEEQLDMAAEGARHQLVSTVKQLLGDVVARQLPGIWRTRLAALVAIAEGEG